jgi:hypothetical protein
VLGVWLEWRKEIQADNLYGRRNLLDLERDGRIMLICGYVICLSNTKQNIKNFMEGGIVIDEKTVSSKRIYCRSP